MFGQRPPCLVVSYVYYSGYMSFVYNVYVLIIFCSSELLLNSSFLFPQFVFVLYFENSTENRPINSMTRLCYFLKIYAIFF